MGLAAAEVAIALSIIIAVYRNYRSIHSNGPHGAEGLSPHGFHPPQPTSLLLAALLAPLVGAGLVMATGKRPNLREACSLLAAVTLFGLVASLVPDVRAGTRCTGFSSRLLPGLSVLPPCRRPLDDVRGLRLVPVDPDGLLLRRVHARPAGTRPDPVQHLLRPRPLRRHRLRLLRQPAHALSVLRDRQRLDLSARGPPPGRGGLRGRRRSTSPT
jgi:hypothetical protein